MGERILRFRILGGQKQTLTAEIDAAAQEYNESPCALPFFPAGAGKKKAPLACYDNKKIILSALKKDGTKTTVRLYNSTAQEETLRLTLPYLNREETLTFGAYEIKTMQYDS